MSLIHEHPPTGSGQPPRAEAARVVTRPELLAALELAYEGRLGAGLVHLDLDRFHHVNTRYGHDVGDRVLQIIGARVLDAVGDASLVAAVDGDGFLVATPGADLEAIRRTAERLLSVIREPVDLGDAVIDVRASAGLACRSADDQRVDLVERAFLACRRAKATAPGTIVGYEGALGTEADRRHRVEDGLRDAIVDRQFRLFVQPKVDLANGDIVGVEALLRWQHPTDGLLLPAAFLPSAEAAGLMVAIGDWVLDEAIDLAARWRPRHTGAPIRMWVNLAAQQLAAGDHLRQRVRSAIADGRLSPQSIGFEVTESSLLEDLPSAVGVLSSLRELGVEIALDDFGTGYSSLSYLRQLPVTAVKIDQRFVAGIGGSLADEVIVEAVIDLAHALGLRVVAEGVEHVGQADALVRMGADFAQGYHFARPMPPDQLEPLLGLAWCGAQAPISRSVTVDRRADDLPGLGSPRARLLLAALDTAHDSILVTSAGGDGRRPPIVYVNEAFHVETGHLPSDVIGRTIEMLLPDPPDPADIAWFDEVQVNAGAATRELASRRADGTLYLCELTISPISDERGVRTHWLHVRRDLTQRLAAEGARARFEGLIEKTPSLVFLAETGGQWVYANAAQRRAIGLPADAPVDGVNIFDLFADEMDRIENDVVPTLQADGLWSGAVDFVDPTTGQRTEAHMDVQVMEDPLRPGVRFFAAVSRDVTELNTLARAEQRRRELGSFAADVAHGAMHGGSDEFIEDIDQVLARFGTLIGADRVNVNGIDMEAGRLFSIAAWSGPRYPRMEAPDELPVGQLPHWVKRLHEGGSGPFVGGLGEGWTSELKDAFPQLAATARLFAPLRVGGELLGVLMLGSVDLDHQWSQDELETVQQVADTLANLFVRQRWAGALAVSEQRAAAMLSNIGDILLVIDGEGWVKYVNDRVEAVLGHQPADVVGGHFLTLVHPDDQNLAIDGFA
ncbi:MAG: Diguanylate cyclase/phosphodiesterase with sensor(S), partial [Ilumatobacteraceae bacterium]|nr:Diguanylate cyclase/phosphodiesterase with sensor(S) [Ilumatobacteraceae bacterium]